MPEPINSSELFAADKEALFTQLYSAVWQDLYRYAYYVLGNRMDAEDAVQEAALRGYSGLHNLRGIESFKAWMFKILSVCCKRRLTQIINIRQAEQSDEILATVPAEDTDLTRAIELRERLAELPPDDRGIVVLSIVGGYKSNEIAAVFDISPGTVRSRLSRALSKLRVSIEREENVI